MNINQKILLITHAITSLNCQTEKTKSETMSNEKSSSTDPQHINNPYYSRTDTAVLHIADSEWKKVLPDSVYQVARNKDTERAFSGKYWNSDGLGIYYCAAC